MPDRRRTILAASTAGTAAMLGANLYAGSPGWVLAVLVILALPVWLLTLITWTRHA